MKRTSNRPISSKETPSAAPPGKRSGQPASSGSGTAPRLKSIGKYRIVKTIGSGGMGTVFLAEDTELRRSVALKVLPKDKAKNPILVRRFKAEAQSAAHLRHENIVSVFEAGEADGWLYIALEYIDGIDLHDFVRRRGTVPVKRSLDIAKQVARALQHAHEHNIVHRDIKPSNLLIRRNGSIKLTDFGLARSVDDTMESGITRAGTTVGTIDYMAPEQARSSKAADIRSDLYSLGCTWFHMLTGQAPYPEGSLTNKLQAHAINPIPNARDLNENIPEGLVAVLQRLLAKKPEDRYQTPAELLEDLEQSHLLSDSVSSQILDAVRDDEESFATAAAAGRDQADAEDEEQTESAPKRHFARIAPSSDTGAETGIGTEWPKYVLAAVVAVGLIWGFATLAMRMSSAFNSPTGTDSYNPFDNREKIERGAQEDRSQGGRTVVNDQSGGDRGKPKPDESMPSNDGQSPTATEQVTAAAPNTNVTPSSDVDDVLESPKNPLLSPGWVASWSPILADHHAVVNAGTVDPSQAPSLMTALQRAAAGQLAIDLEGSQPFGLSAFQTASIPGLSISAPAGNPAVVLVRPEAVNDDGSIISLTNGSLELANIHFVVDLRHLGTSTDLTLFAVHNGDAILRNCVIQVLGPPEVAIQAVRMSGRATDVSRRPRDAVRVLLDRTRIQGPRVTAVRLTQNAADVVVTGSLLLLGSGNAVNMPSVAADGDTDRDRYIRFVDSTVVTQSSAITLPHAPQGDDTVPQTTFGAVRSVLAHCGPDAAGLLSLGDWPVNSVRSGDTGRYRGLDWKSVDSAFLGWPALVDIGTDDYAVDGAAGWRRAWKDPAVDCSFLAESWPTTVPADWTEATADDFSATGLPADVLQTVAGRRIGCEVANLGRTRAWISEHINGARTIPLVTAQGIISPTWAREVQVDLNAQDLGDVVAKLESTDRVLIRAIGQGQCTTSPVQFNSGHVKIQFQRRNANAPPLILAPKLRRREDGAWSMFRMVGGTLEIEGAVIELPAIANRDLPEWLLDVRNGDFRLVNCFVRGPAVNLQGHDGLIRSAPASLNGVNAERRIGSIEESFLLGAGDLINLRGGHHDLFVSNSLMISRGNVFGVTLGDADDRVVCRFASFVNSDSAFRVAGDGGGAASMFVEACAFLGAWDRVGVSDHPRVVQCPKPVWDAKRVRWWGVSNGYTSDYVSPLSVGDQTADGNGWAHWLKAWPEGAELRPLYGDDAIVTAREPERSRTDLAPAHFVLSETCTAAFWNGAGDPIGAPFKGRTTARTDQPETSGSKSPPTPTGGRRVIGF